MQPLPNDDDEKESSNVTNNDKRIMQLLSTGNEKRIPPGPTSNITEKP